MKRHRSTNRLGDGPQLIDPIAMIAMHVRDDEAVEVIYPGREQLLAQVRTAIDEHPLLVAFDKDRGAQAGISRLLGIALTPFVADLGNAGRRPAAENSDFHAALLNSLKKFAVVASASCSGSSPRRSATKLAVSATNAGSHFCPRCGTGARNGASVSTSIWPAGSHLAVACKSWAFLKVTIPDRETK